MTVRVTAAQVKKLQSLIGKLEMLQAELPGETKAKWNIQDGKRHLIDALMTLENEHGQHLR